MMSVRKLNSPFQHARRRMVVVSQVHDLGMDWFLVVWLEEDVAPELVSVVICPISHSWRVILGKATKRIEVDLPNVSGVLSPTPVNFEHVKPTFPSRGEHRKRRRYEVARQGCVRVAPFTASRRHGDRPPLLDARARRSSSTGGGSGARATSASPRRRPTRTATRTATATATRRRRPASGGARRR